MATKTSTKLTPAKAADVWAEAKRTMDTLKPQLEAAAEVLKEHFRDTGKARYKGIGYSVGSRRQLDTEKVKNELYDRIEDFQKTVQYESLTLLED